MKTDHHARPCAGPCGRVRGLRPQAQIKIGVAGPITGPNAAFGAQLKNGDRAGGRRHQRRRRHPRPEDHARRYGDDVSDPKQGVSVANKFVGDGVKFVIGHFNSGVTMPASEVYQENGILEITPSATNPEDHRARHVEHLPHLRPRRPAGRGRRRLHRQATSRARRSPSSTTRPPTARASPTRPRRR